MIESKPPKNLWTKAHITAMYMTNGSSTNALPNVTPYEIWFRERLDISNLRIVGCRVVTHVPKPTRQELDDTGRSMIMHSYVINDYRLYDPQAPIGFRWCRAGSGGTD